MSTPELVADLTDALRRAVHLLDATRRFIRDNHLEEYTVFYDETTCDGSCLSEDCQLAEEDAKDAIGRAEGKIASIVG